MFEQFTERARKVLSLSRQEAQRLNSEFIGTEHVLLGIIQEGGGVAAKVLKNLNMDLKRVRQEIEKLVVPSTAPTSTLGALPFSPAVKRVFDCAQEEAVRMGHGVVGTEHLLLGLLRMDEGIAVNILKNLGIEVKAVEDMTREVLGADFDMPKVVPKPQPLRAKAAFPSRFVPGMSYRHWLVGMALQGILANDTNRGVKSAAQNAIEAADEVLRLLEEGEAKK